MSVNSATSSTAIRTDFLNLLVKQLQTQNPLEPMDNNQMATQLAQLSQLEQTENMAATFKDVLAYTQKAQASTMIGKTVTFTIPNDEQLYKGVVQNVDLTQGDVRVTVGKFQVELSDIQTISN